MVETLLETIKQINCLLIKRTYHYALTYQLNL